jgi:hypothetical protein
MARDRKKKKEMIIIIIIIITVRRWGKVGHNAPATWTFTAKLNDFFFFFSFFCVVFTCNVFSYYFVFLFLLSLHFGFIDWERSDLCCSSCAFLIFILCRTL